MRGRRRLAVVGLLTFGVLTASAGSASATSCVGWPDDVADRIVAGRLPALGGTGGTEAFTDRYDFAVVGTVRAVGGADPVTARLDVRAAFFRPVGSSLTVEMQDGGALLGYPFEVGRTYLVPVKDEGPDGLHNYVMLCDPVTLLSDAEATRLSALAPTPPTTAPTATPTTAHGDPGGHRAATLTGAGLLAAAAVAGLAYALSRRRSR